jgi:cellulose synthase/poly-beta-1,6-N-acetylglucosamine synthase-like glycosyltransferase
MASAKQTDFDVTEKKATLYVFMIGIWFLILVGSVLPFWRTFNGLHSLWAKALFVPFACCLALFWFYGVYHLVFLIFSYMPKRNLAARAQALAKERPASPKVAIIYTTYNDFNREAALTCLNQDYPDCRLFLLDVSTNPDMRKLVDAFHEEFASSTTLVRLEPRQGFKARSLNDTLKTAVTSDYEFFAVCDADNLFPPDFLSRTIPYFQLDERIAFVQAAPASSGRSQGKFPKYFEVAIDASWALHQRSRDRYGLLMLMGHSVVVRREAWEKVGGYPEIVQEDTAFTMRLREHGYYGIFAPEVLCGEEFPEDFGRCRRRQFRLVQADTEILSTQMPRFLRDKGISLIEKLDLLARTIRLPSEALTFVFLALAFPLIPLVESGALCATSLDRAFGPMIGPGLVGVTLLAASAPLGPFVVYMRWRPGRLIRLLFHSIPLHCSFLVLAIVSFVAYVLRGRAMFLVTGTQDGAAIQSQPRGALRVILQRLSADSPLVTILDMVSGLILGYVGIATGSLVLIGVASVLLISPMVRRFGWENKAIAVVVYLPLALILAGLVTSLSGGIGAQSQYLALAVLSVLLF